MIAISGCYTLFPTFHNGESVFINMVDRGEVIGKPIHGFYIVKSSDSLYYYTIEDLERINGM